MVLVPADLRIGFNREPYIKNANFKPKIIIYIFWNTLRRYKFFLKKPSQVHSGAVFYIFGPSNGWICILVWQWNLTGTFNQKHLTLWTLVLISRVKQYFKNRENLLLLETRDLWMKLYRLFLRCSFSRILSILSK